MRTLNELYQLLYDSIVGDCKYICLEIGRLYLNNKITSEEEIYLNRHFFSQKPSEFIHVEFYNDGEYYKNSNLNGAWWVSNTNIGSDIRKKFIQKMIQITKDI